MTTVQWNHHGRCRRLVGMRTFIGCQADGLPSRQRGGQRIVTTELFPVGQPLCPGPIQIAAYRPTTAEAWSPIRPRLRSKEGTDMTALYTWDVFSTLDGYGSYAEGADWGGYWGKQGPELLKHRAALFDTEQRMVFGATTFRENAEIMTSGIDPNS